MDMAPGGSACGSRPLFCLAGPGPRTRPDLPSGAPLLDAGDRLRLRHLPARPGVVLGRAADRGRSWAGCFDAPCSLRHPALRLADDPDCRRLHGGHSLVQPSLPALRLRLHRLAGLPAGSGDDARLRPGLLCDEAGERRRLSSHVGRPARRTQGAQSQPDLRGRGLRHAGAQPGQRLLPRHAGDHRARTLYPQEARDHAGLRYDRGAAGRLRANGLQVSRTESLHLR